MMHGPMNVKFIPHTLLWNSIQYQLQYVSSVECITRSVQVVLFGNMNQTAFVYASVPLTQQKYTRLTTKLPPVHSVI